MRDERVVKRLYEQLNNGSDSQQAIAVESIRDLSVEQEFRLAFAEAGIVPPLVGLLDSPDKGVSVRAAEALRYLAEEDALREAIRDAGGINNLVGLLKTGNQASLELQTAVLETLLAMAVDEPNRLAINRANGLPTLVKILEQSDDQVLLEMSAGVLGRMTHSKLNKNSAREHNGLLVLLRLLQKPSTGPKLAQKIVEALTISAMDNEVNQDYVREQYGIAPLIKLLEKRPSAPLCAAVVTCLQAVCINNEANKDAVRDAWGIPLLVNLLEPQVEQRLVEKAVDCLRILTTGNNQNQLALFSIPAGVRSLVRLMSAFDPQAMITERAAATVGNLSATEQFFSAIRECGGLQRLVALLDSGSESRVTEIAAKTLANMAASENNRKGIRLAGGLPPLVNLLTQRPSEQVLIASEEALSRLEVGNVERNAVLETLRYSTERQAQGSTVVADASSSGQPLAHATSIPAVQAARPFTQFSVAETCTLLRALGLRDTKVFGDNGITGGDLLELTAEEMAEILQMTPLQVKKLRNVHSAFDAFERISKTPGKADITVVELRDWMQEVGRSQEEARAIVEGFKLALGREQLALMGFTDFVRCYHWFVRTLQGMQAAEQGGEIRRMPSFASVGSAAISPLRKQYSGPSASTEANGVYHAADDTKSVSTTAIGTGSAAKPPTPPLAAQPAEEDSTASLATNELSDKNELPVSDIRVPRTAFEEPADT